VLEKLLARFQESQGETAWIKDFVCVLLLYREHVAVEIQAAVELALEHQISSSAGVRHILLHTHGTPTPAPLSHYPATLLPDLSAYGQLGVVL
jgi:hypothetical protein